LTCRFRCGLNGAGETTRTRPTYNHRVHLAVVVESGMIVRPGRELTTHHRRIKGAVAR